MNYLLYFTLLNSFFSFAQINNGVITYGVIKSEIDSYSETGNDYLIKAEKEAKEMASLLNFTLSFNKKESCFLLDEVILPENKDKDMVLTLLQVNTKLYENKSKKISRKYINSTRIGEVAETEPFLYEWTITKETKIIDGYTCYKAISPLYTDGKKIEDTKFNVIAWFTPKIPVPYGPNGYGGLPGLILELQKYASTIYVKTIDLNSTPEPKIEKLESYPQLTNVEIKEYMMSTLTPEQKKAVLESKKIKN
jgi:GLPGLI family protein